MVEILDVEPGSIAAELGLAKGDKIISINGQPLRDYIDYQYETAENYFTLEVKKVNGEYWQLEVEREPGEELGIIFDGIIFDRLKLCRNNCLFCFVKQQPSGMRDSLLLKDDDYRFSFLQGSFITLTNLSEEEFARIIALKLSPLNISVHTTDLDLRVRMMKNPEAGRIMEQLRRLAGAGIRFNTQVVLCPGFNDQDKLDRTIEDLISFYPSIISLGIVPVGLTKYRDGLDKLRGYDREGAREVLKQIKSWQEKVRGLYGENFIYCSDEFYLLAGEELPLYEEYNGFPQIENGIGLTRLLWYEFEKLKPSLPPRVGEKSIAIVTGVLGAEVFKPIKKRLDLIEGLNLEIIPVENSFFGESVTVTGLLTGSDIIKGLAEKEELPDQIIIPGITLNEEGKFLDDLTLRDLEERFPEKEFFLCCDIGDVLEVIVNGKTGCGNCWPAECRQINPL